MTAQRQPYSDGQHDPPSRSRRLLLRAAGVGAFLGVAGASSYRTLSNRPEATTTSDEITGQETTATTAADESLATATTDPSADGPIVEWQMPTSWPETLPVLWGNTRLFTERLAELTGGRFTITPFPAGELSSPIEVLDVVTSGDFTIGSTATYYYIEQSPVLAFGTALPFGLTMRQQTSWLYYGGGLELLQKFYADRFNVIQFPAGNTGAQMGGWFTREINSLDDIQGLRMRIPGLGGQVMERLGAEVVNLGAADILGALQSGEVDAAEFVGPYDDSNLGLQDSAGFYYHPGFWEPGASLDLIVNQDAWNDLPPLYQTAFRSAAFEALVRVTAEYDARNGQALNELVAGGTELREFPADVIEAGQAAAGLLLDEIAEGDADFKNILEQWRSFRRQVGPWFSLAEAGSIE